MAYKSKYKPKNPDKYVGDPDKIISRSTWEYSVMRFLDENPSVIFWASEEMCVRYYDPVTNKERRYFPDFLVKFKGTDGKITIMMLEVKPKAQTREPKPRKSKSRKLTRRFIAETLKYNTNAAKWKAAIKYCKEKGWVFRLITEDELGLFTK